MLNNILKILGIILISGIIINSIIEFIIIIYYYNK